MADPFAACHVLGGQGSLCGGRDGTKIFIYGLLRRGRNLAGGEPSSRCFAHNLLASAAVVVLRPLGTQMSGVGSRTPRRTPRGAARQARRRRRASEGSPGRAYYLQRHGAATPAALVAAV